MATLGPSRPGPDRCWTSPLRQRGPHGADSLLRAPLPLSKAMQSLHLEDDLFLAAPPGPLWGTAPEEGCTATRVWRKRTRSRRKPRRRRRRNRRGRKERGSGSGPPGLPEDPLLPAAVAVRRLLRKDDSHDTSSSSTDEPGPGARRPGPHRGPHHGLRSGPGASRHPGAAGREETSVGDLASILLSVPPV